MQIAALSRVEDESFSDDESWGDELEKELELDETESQPKVLLSLRDTRDITGNMVLGIAQAPKASQPSTSCCL